MAKSKVNYRCYIKGKHVEICVIELTTNSIPAYAWEHLDHTLKLLVATLDHFEYKEPELTAYELALAQTKAIIESQKEKKNEP